MKNHLLLLTLLVALVSFNGCKKEGCTDPDSTSYNEKAKKDNGTCQYEGEMVFWYSQTTSAELIADNATSLTIRVDGSVVGSYATSVYFTGVPTCMQNGAVSVTKDLGGDKSKSYSYSVIDDTGWEYWSGTVTFTANTCLPQELKF